MYPDLSDYVNDPSTLFIVSRKLWDEGEADYWDHEVDRRDFLASLLVDENHEDSSRPTVDMVREVLEALGDLWREGPDV